MAQSETIVWEKRRRCTQAVSREDDRKGAGKARSARSCMHPQEQGVRIKAPGFPWPWVEWAAGWAFSDQMLCFPFPETKLETLFRIP